MRLATWTLVLMVSTATASAVPPFEVLKYGTLGTKQANCDAVIQGSPGREEVIAVVKELVAHYKALGFRDVYVGCYRDTDVGRHMAVDEFHEPPMAQIKANWLCLYSKIGSSESISFKPWDWLDEGMNVSYYSSATPTVELGGSREKPRYPSSSAARAVPEPAPLPDPDQQLFDAWVRDVVRQWPGVSSLSSSRGCTLAVFDTYLTGKGAQGLARGLASEYLLRQYGIWTEAALLVAELGSPISEIANSADEISAGICVVVTEPSGQRHTWRLRPRGFLSPASN